jgi:lipoprotein
MKKLTIIAGIPLITALTITGCGSNDTTQKPDTTQTTQPETDSPRRVLKPCGADTTGDIEMGQGLCDHEER